MSGLSALLAIDTGALDAKITLSLDASHAGATFASFDPLALLGPAGESLRAVGDLVSQPPDIGGALAGGLDILADVAPFADVPELGEAMAVLAAVKARLQPLKALMDLDPAALVNRIMADAGGFDGAVQGLATGFGDALAGALPDAIAGPAAALGDLAGGAAGSAAELADVLVRMLTGIDLAAVSRPYALLDGLRSRVEAAGGLDPVRERIFALTVRVNLSAEALLGRAPRLEDIALELDAIRTGMGELTGTLLPDAIERLTGDLLAVDLPRLVGDLDAALTPLIDRLPSPPVGVAAALMPPFRALADAMDGITAQSISELLADVEAEVRAMFAESDVRRLRDDAADLLGGVLAFLQGLPLPSLRARLTQALLAVREEIADLADFSPVGAIGTKILTVQEAIDGIELTAVRERVEALAGQITGLAALLPIEAVRDELIGLIGTASDAVAQLPPLVDELRAAVEALAGQITTIDLSPAGEEAAGLIRDLRANVRAALGSADIPAAAKAPIGILAGEVRTLNLSASLDAPLADLVGKIDVSVVLAPVQAAIDRAREALLSLSPTALAARLDAPFDGMLAGVQQVSPDALKARLSAAFGEAAGQVDRLDPVTLVQPLQDRFDAAIGALRAAADPAPLLAPLRSVYGEVGALLDAIDPELLLARIMGEVSRLPGRFGDMTRAAVEAKVGAGESLAVAAPAPWRFGDILRPLAALIAEARAAVKDAAEDVLGDAMELASRPLALLAQAGRMAGGHVAAIGAAIEAQRGVVDATATHGPLPELRRALDRLERIEAALAAGGRSSARLNAAVVSVQLDAHVTASFPARERLGDATEQLLAGLSVGDAGRGLRGLGSAIASAVPDALTLPDTQAAVLARIDALFDAVDVAPLVIELDAVSDAINAKLQAAAAALAQGLFGIWNAIFEELHPALPQGILPVLGQVTDAVRAQLAALDPALLEAELDAVLDGVVAALGAYSPAAMAGTLTGSFDTLKAKLAELDPATMLGDLSALQDAIDGIAALRPTTVLAPLVGEAEALDAALLKLLDLDPVAIVEAAIAGLRAQLEAVLQTIEVEVDELLGDLESAGNGGASVSL